MFEKVSIKDKISFVFNIITPPFIPISNIKSIFKLSGLINVFYSLVKSGPQNIHILQLAHMSLKSLLIYRFILPFLSFIQVIHLLKKHVSYRNFLQSGFCYHLSGICFSVPCIFYRLGFISRGTVTFKSKILANTFHRRYNVLPSGGTSCLR